MPPRENVESFDWHDLIQQAQASARQYGVTRDRDKDHFAVPTSSRHAQVNPTPPFFDVQALLERETIRAARRTLDHARTTERPPTSRAAVPQQDSARNTNPRFDVADLLEREEIRARRRVQEHARAVQPRHVTVTRDTSTEPLLDREEERTRHRVQDRQEEQRPFELPRGAARVTVRPRAHIPMETHEQAQAFEGGIAGAIAEYDTTIDVAAAVYALLTSDRAQAIARQTVMANGTFQPNDFRVVNRDVHTAQQPRPTNSSMTPSQTPLRTETVDEIAQRAKTDDQSRRKLGQIAGGECPVCMGRYKKSVVSTTCGHVFCKECVVGHMRSNSRCPVCRRNHFVNDLIRIHGITEKQEDVNEEKEAIGKRGGEEAGEEANEQNDNEESDEDSEDDSGEDNEEEASNNGDEQDVRETGNDGRARASVVVTEMSHPGVDNHAHRSDYEFRGTRLG